MRHWFLTFIVALLGCHWTFSAPEEKVIYYVQLVRGNNDITAPTPGAKPIGPKLSKSLRSVLNWTHYWEVSRREAALAVGAKCRVNLSKERAVEIDLRQPNKCKVTAWSGNKPVSRSTQPVNQAMTIIGSDRDRNSAWFVVVRRDKPTTD